MKFNCLFEVAEKYPQFRELPEALLENTNELASKKLEELAKNLFPNNKDAVTSYKIIKGKASSKGVSEYTLEAEIRYKGMIHKAQINIWPGSNKFGLNLAGKPFGEVKTVHGSVSKMNTHRRDVHSKDYPLTAEGEKEMKSKIKNLLEHDWCFGDPSKAA